MTAHEGSTLPSFPTTAFHFGATTAVVTLIARLWPIRCGPRWWAFLKIRCYDRSNLVWHNTSSVTSVQHLLADSVVPACWIWCMLASDFPVVLLVPSVNMLVSQILVLLRSTPLMLTCSSRDDAFTFSGSLRGKQAMCHRCDLSVTQP
jgi:hypothetical protein